MNRHALLSLPPYYHHHHQHSHAYHHPHAHALPPTVHQPQYHEQAFAPSLAWTTTPLSPHPISHAEQQHRQQQQQQQIVVANAYQDSLLRQRQASIPPPRYHHNHHVFQEHLLPLRPRHYSVQTVAMAAPQMSTEELDELQQLSNHYEPEATGPLVGQRQPSSAIAVEYATADPVYQQKTAALPQKYSHYRTVRGDGKCGWRAIAFGYYEGLIRLGDPNKFLEEETRLRSLGNILNAAGFETYIYEDYQQEMLDLMRHLATVLHGGDAYEALETALNDDMTQMSIITHLRILVSAWLKTYPANYEPFLLGQTTDDYAKGSIMPVASEIEHVGLSALNSVLLAPAGMALEVLYLDRSVGTEANMHRFDSEAQTAMAIHTIRLLYRPGHYDILYKPEDMPPEPSHVPTYLQISSHAHQDPVHYLGVSDFLTMIPGMSYAPSCQGWMPGSAAYGASSDFFQPTSTAQQSAVPLHTPTTPAPQPQPQQLQPQAAYDMPAISSTHRITPPAAVAHELAVRSMPPPPSIAHPIQHQLVGGGPFRPSIWELEPDFVQATSQMPFQTSIFRNSHFNTAHFLNPDFQPEEWSPDAEYVTTNNTKSRQKYVGPG